MSQFNNRIKRSVVFFGKCKDNNVNFVATGFLVMIEKIFHLVTAKHVVYDEKDHSWIDEDYYIFWNGVDGNIKLRLLSQLTGDLGVNWVFHPDDNVDIAITAFVSDPALDAVSYIPEDLFVMPDQFFELDDVFFASYQPGMKFEGKINPIFRMGMVSRINQDGSFYIDGAAFPGNSGSPVFLKPSPMKYDNESDLYIIATNQMGGSLIGVISSYIPYQDIAISSQTKKPRVVFEENTGLSIVWSIKQLKEIIQTPTFNEHLKFIRETHSDKFYNIK